MVANQKITRLERSPREAQGDNYLERYIAHQRPAGTEPVTLAVDYLNRLCDAAYGGEHRYTLNQLGKWRRWLAGGDRPNAEPPPRAVVDVIRAELLVIVLMDRLGEQQAAQICEYIGLPNVAGGKPKSK